MVLIFGWGGGPAEDRGEVAGLRCPNCHNDVWFHKVRSTKQVSLFFVPVMPYGTDEYLLCPVCRHRLQTAPAHQSAVEGMRMTTAAFRAGRITEPDYRARTDAFWLSMGVAPSAIGPATQGDAGRPGTAAAPPAEAALADRLAGLGRLHAAGILTDDEFGAAKRQLLER